ncbi:hypothetical protein ACNOYE_14085 [Nannocystaceae bacterium ST9]
MGICDDIDRTGIVDISEVVSLLAHRRSASNSMESREGRGTGCTGKPRERPRWTLNLSVTPSDPEGECDTPGETPPIAEIDLPPPGAKDPAPTLCEEDRAATRRLIAAIRRTSRRRSPHGSAQGSGGMAVDAKVGTTPDGLDIKYQGFPQEYAGTGCVTDRDAPHSLNQAICSGLCPPLDVDSMALPEAVPYAEDCLEAIWSAWITINRVLDCTKRIQVQWWNASSLSSKNPKDFLGELPDGLESPPIERIAKHICLAGARLTRGVSFDGTTPPELRFVRRLWACGSGDPADVRLVGDEVQVCAGWPNLPPGPAATPKTSLTAALLQSDALGPVNPLPIDVVELARWIHARHGEFGDLRSTTFNEWDLRPDASRKPMLERMHPYNYVVTKGWERDRIRRAWDGSWRWVEAAWRFLFRAGLIYRDLAEAQGEAVAEQALRDLWRMGGNHDPMDFSVGRAYIGPEGIPRCPFDAAYADYDRDSYNVSLQTWFGSYSNTRFLTVWWVITALASRYQGRFPDDFMSNVMWRTKFHAVRWGKRSVSYPTGEIWLKNNFFKGDEDYCHRNLCHEMMHYLVKSTNGGRPRDIYNPACTDDEHHKCYGDDNAVMLATTGDWEAVKNVDNYRGWLFQRYLRWCDDWPPSTDRASGDPYVGDPISDEVFFDEGFDEPGRVSWSLLLEVRDRMFDSNWEPFGF